MGNLLSSGTQITIGGVTCWDEGTEENFERTKRSAVRTIVCEWANRAALINGIRAGATSIGGVYAYDVEPYPDFPDLYPEKFTIKGVGALSVGPKGGPAYQWARIQVTYSSMYGAEAQGQVGIEMATSILSLPKSGICLVSESGKNIWPEDAGGIPLLVYSITRSVRNMGSLSMSTLAQAGKKPLNASAIFGFDPGCVLFEGGRAVRQTLSRNGTGIDQQSVNPRFNPLGVDGSMDGVWDVEYRFSARPQLPWDVRGFRNGTEFKFERVKYLGTNPFTGTDELIGRSDLNALFPQSGNLFPVRGPA